MNVYTGPSCSKEYQTFIECKNSYNTRLCFCCLAANVSVIDIRKCDHKDFIIQCLMEDIAELYICASCHHMLKKIDAFKKQIYENYNKRINHLIKDNNLDYRLTVRPLSRTGVTVVSYNTPAVNTLELYTQDEEFQEHEVPVIKSEVDSDSNYELSYCVLSPEAIDNSTPTIDNIEPNRKQARTRNKKKVTIDNIDEKKIKQSIDIMMKNVDQIKKKESIEKLERKYVGKIKLLNLSIDELLKERAEKRLKEPYSKMEYKCEMCVKGFIYDHTFNDHMKKRHAMKSGEYSCEICKSVFSKKHACSYHYKRHFKRYVCLACNKIHKDLDSVAEHYNAAHPEREPIQMSFVCRKCDFVTSSPRKYRYHLVIHTDGRTCKKCNKILSTKQTYTEHIRLCHDKTNRTFKCENCSKTYKGRSGLYAHRKYGECANAPVKTGYCVPCNMYFKTEKNYEMHLKISSAHVAEDAFKFTCDICNKKFVMKTPLEYHMIREHLKIKNFKCSYCEKMLFSKKILKNHINYVHLKLRPPRDKICDFCGKAFHSLQILQAHRRIHTGERPFRCPFCEATFGHKAALYTHKKLVHKVPPKNTL